MRFLDFSAMSMHPRKSACKPRRGIAGPGRAIVRVHGLRVTVVQQRTRCGSMKAHPAGVGLEATTEGASCRRTEARKIVTRSALLRSDHPTAVVAVGDSLAWTIGSIPPGHAGASERVTWVTWCGLGSL